MKTVLWFRRDLRIEDNPLLSQPAEVLPLFIFDAHILSELRVDDKRVSFIFEKVLSLKTSLQSIGLDLALFYGEPVHVFEHLKSKGFHSVYASGDYDTYAKERDRAISHLMEFHYLHDTYIFQPQEVLKGDGSFYRVFTPFYKQVLKQYTKRCEQEYVRAPQKLFAFDYGSMHVITATSHHLKPVLLDTIGFNTTVLCKEVLEDPVMKLNKFASFLKEYENDRDFLNQSRTSNLSIDLRFGTLSIRQVLRFLRLQKENGVSAEAFFRQLIFREFYAMLLTNNPQLETQSATQIPVFQENEHYITAVLNAQTGVPIVDAALTQLFTTGLMHNRARMVVASFICKHLLLPWQWGEKLFASHLLDYDKASNVLSWQWAAGTGIDAQPFMRIFNPYLQSAKFDPDCTYIKRHLPHLEPVPCSTLHNEARLLARCESNYPTPIVLHAKARQRALHCYSSKAKGA